MKRLLRKQLIVLIIGVVATVCALAVAGVMIYTNYLANMT